MNRGRIVGVMTGCSLDNWGNVVWFPEKQDKILFYKTPRPALGPSQTLIQWVAWTHSSGVMWLGHETDHPASSSVKARNEWSHTCTSHMVCNGTVYIHFTLQRGQVSTVVPNLPEEGNTFSCSAALSSESSSAFCRTPLRHSRIKPSRCDNLRPCIRLATTKNSGPCSALLSMTLTISHRMKVQYNEVVLFYTRTRSCGK